MQAYPYNYRQGNTWLSSGFATFKKASFTWASAMAAYLLLISVAQVLVSAFFKDFFTNLLFTLLTLSSLWACFFVSFMIMAQHTQRDERFFSLSLLFSGFTRQVNSLLLIGLIKGGLMFLSVRLWFFFDPVMFEAVLFFQQTQDPAALKGVTMLPLFLFLTALVSIKILFVYAPILAAFYKVSPLKSIVFSAIAISRNLKPWLAFIFLLIVVCCISFFIMLSIGSFVPEFKNFIPIIMKLCMICFLYPIVYASIYKSFMDIFKIDSHLPMAA